MRHEPYFTAGRVIALFGAVGLLWLCHWLFGAFGFDALVGIPWALMGTGGLYVCGVMWWERRSDRRLIRRADAGLCERCGYDLRGAAHDLCPECGMPVWRPYEFGPADRGAK